MNRNNNATMQLPTGAFTVAPGVWGLKEKSVNMYFIQDLTSENWMLVDTGLRWSYIKIKKMATALFGKESKPACIVLTHAHFDHIGSVERLAEEWDVPVFAHYMEIPYLTGKSSYQPADTTAEKGVMASLAILYPNKPINIWQHIQVLPADESIPGVTGWKYIFTPGHTPGHISLFREEDKTLIVGDAFVTTPKESAISIITNRKVNAGSPKYFISDWETSEASVSKLADLLPTTAATSHGAPLRGTELIEALKNFEGIIKSEFMSTEGMNIEKPAMANKKGFVFIPQKHPLDVAKIAWSAFGVSAAITLGYVLNIMKNNKRRKQSNQHLLDIEYNF